MEKSNQLPKTEGCSAEGEPADLWFYRNEQPIERVTSGQEALLKAVQADANLAPLIAAQSDAVDPDRGTGYSRLGVRVRLDPVERRLEPGNRFWARVWGQRG